MSTTDYASFISGKLKSGIISSDTTGVQVTILEINGSAPTWPTGAHRIMVVRKTRTGLTVECIGVASGTTQTGSTVTLGTLTRGLSLTDGTDFTGDSSRKKAFPANADVYITWDTQSAEQTAFKDTANTFSAHQTISSTNELRLGGSTVAVWKDGSGNLSFKDPANGTKTLTTLAAASGADEKAKVSSNDTTQGYLNGKLVAGAGITLTENSDGGDETLSIIAQNTVATGHTGAVSLTNHAVLLGAGTSAVNGAAPGSSGTVLMSNGASSDPSFQAITVPYYQKIVLAPAAASTTLTNPTSATAFDTYTYTVPANFLVSGSGVEVDVGGSIVKGASSTVVLGLYLGSTEILSGTFSADSNNAQFTLKGKIYGTTTAGTGKNIVAKIEGGFNTGTNFKGFSNVTLPTLPTADTNGTLALTIKATFGTSNGSNAIFIQSGDFKTFSTTPF